MSRHDSRPEPCTILLVIKMEGASYYCCDGVLGVLPGWDTSNNDTLPFSLSAMDSGRNWMGRESGDIP